MQTARSRTRTPVDTAPLRRLAAAWDRARRLGGPLAPRWESARAHPVTGDSESTSPPAAAEGLRGPARWLLALGALTVMGAYVVLPLNVGTLVLLGAIVAFAWTADAGQQRPD